MTSRLMPASTPTESTFMVGSTTFRIGQTIELEEAEAEILIELRDLFQQTQDGRRSIFQGIHVTPTDFDPEMHADYHAFTRLFWVFQHRTHELINMICDRIGAFLPLQVDYRTNPEDPKVFVRPATQNDPITLTVPQISAVSGFTRQAAEIRALALALNDSFKIEDVGKATFDYFDWIEFGVPFFRAQTPSGLLGSKEQIEPALLQSLDLMLNEGAVYGSLQSTQQTGYLFPMLGVIVGHQETRIINLREIDGSVIKGKTNQDRQFAAIKKHIVDMGVDTVKAWFVLQAASNLPKPQADQEDTPGKQATTPGFLVSFIGIHNDLNIGYGFELGNREQRGTVTMKYKYPNAGPTAPLAEMLAIYRTAAAEARPTGAVVESSGSPPRVNETTEAVEAVEPTEDPAE